MTIGWWLVKHDTATLTFFINRLSDESKDIHIDADGSGYCDITGSDIKLADIIS